MDRRLSEAVLKGDITSLHKLIEEDENIIKQTVPGSLNTILHIAARLDHVQLASEIVTLCPEMVSAENKELETPLHEACREGQLIIAKLLLDTDPWVAYKVNCRDESALFVACERGRLEVVKHLLNFPMLLKLEVDMLTSSLHVAASSGHTEIVKELLQARPDFAGKKDAQGCTPLHLASSKGHLDIAREFLRMDIDLFTFKDNEGRTPLHSAAIKGRINVIDEILSVSLESAEMTTNHGETILHLAVKNNQYEVVRYLMETINTAELLNLPDNDGNNVLHLATAAKLGHMVIYLLKFSVDVNALNRKGYTALDVVEADASNSGTLTIVPALVEAGAKRCDQLSPGLRDIQQVTTFNSEMSEERIINMSAATRHKKNQQSPSPRHHHRQSRQREKQIELQNEGLRNARKTIAVVAVLIATVTFTAGINPPGGFSQETGKALRGKKAAFKVFLVCNIVALFLSLGIVNVLVSIIPFRRKSMMKIMVATHKVMWVSTLFMASAYIAAIWTIMPQDKGTRWVTVELVSIGGGCTMLVFLSLGLLLARHWYRKHEWRKRKGKKTKDGSPHSSVSRVGEMKVMRNYSHDYSSNSDVESSDHGYHLY